MNFTGMSVEVVQDLNFKSVQTCKAEGNFL